MPSDIMVWDLETIPDLRGYARAHNLIGRSPDEIRSAMGDTIPLSASAHWLPREHRMDGKYKQSEHPTWVSALRKN